MGNWNPGLAGVPAHQTTKRIACQMPHDVTDPIDDHPVARLEARQDEVLLRIDALNAQIEQVIAEFVPGADKTADTAPAAGPLTLYDPDGPTC